MIHYNNCPVCNSADVHQQLSAKDYTVSGETFFIWHCNNCTVRFTQDVPGQDAIGPYYQSSTYISHSDTKEGFVNNLYHKVRRRTLISKRKLVSSQAGKATGSILDIGCGTGAFLNEMKAAGWQITGLEPDETARKNAASLYNIEPLASNKLFELKSGSYDAITMWHVLEHVHELHAYIKQAAELLNNNDVLCIAVPNYTSYDAGLYKEFWAAYDVPRHLYHFSPGSISHLLEPYNLTLTAMRPMWFDSFYVSMLSEQYKTGKKHIIKAFFNGFISNCKALFNKSKCSSVIYIIKKTD